MISIDGVLYQWAGELCEHLSGHVLTRLLTANQNVQQLERAFFYHPDVKAPTTKQV